MPISKQCACPLDGVPAATEEAMRGRRCSSVGPASIVSLACSTRAEIDAVSSEKRILCVWPRRHQDGGDGVWAAIVMAMRFWTLPSSQCPGDPRVNTLCIPISARSAPRSRSPMRRRDRGMKLTKTLEFPAGTRLGAPQDSARGRCARRWLAPHLGMLADRGLLQCSTSPVTTASPYLSPADRVNREQD
jgi:hypothetical protein